MMKRKYTKKSVTISTAIALSVAAAVYTLGCSGNGGRPDMCQVPIEASLSTMDRIGGATTSIELYRPDGSEWTLFNIANELHATPVGMAKGMEYSLEVEGYIHDIELVDYNGGKYALLSMGDEGIAVVNVTDPAGMSKVTSTKVNYAHEGITWAEGGGDIIPDNNISSTRAPISSLAVYDEGNVTSPSLQLLIGDEGYGLHKTALSNLFDTVNGREDDGTLLIDGVEAYTLQYAGENPWGGPKSLKLYGDGNGTKLFVAQGYLGMGIYDPKTLEQIGRYNLYTDASERNGGEDWFIDMHVADTVQGPTYLDVCTGMPNYNQANFEIQQVWHGDVNASTPWADFDRYGKFYYDARKIDVATFTGGAGPDKTVAYIAYGLGGLIAVDVTGYDSATARDANCTSNGGFLEGSYLGYVPALPAHGAEEMTGEEAQSLYPYFGAGMLKEAGTIDVKVNPATNTVYFSDHFAGLMVIGDADHPEAQWHGSAGIGGYNNDTNPPLGNHWPDYEFVTSYDMTMITPTGSEEEMPIFIYETPILLTTGEVSGHGNVLRLTDTFDPGKNGAVDVVLAAGAGGLNFIDVDGAGSDYNFTVPAHFATTAEVGAAADGSPTQEISIGHAEGVDSYGSYVFLGDGPHGMSVWKVADPLCYPTDNVHLVANTLQSEYPVEIGGVTINPAPHAYDVVLDTAHQTALVMSQSRGLRRVASAKGTVGSPRLLYPANTDIYEHNTDAGNVTDFLHMQDHTYGVALRGNLVFTADGSNGLTVYDLSKDPTDANNSNGFVVANIGGNTDSQPDLGRASGVALWNDTENGINYAFVAAGSRGIAVVDVTNVLDNNMTLVKIFEPIKIEDDTIGKADGKSVAVKVVGDHAFFTYDSFGVVAYSIADLIKPLPEGVDPQHIWEPGEAGERPVAAARFKLQDPAFFGSEAFAEWSGGSSGMDVVQVDDRVLFYIAYGDAGVIKIDWTDPAVPQLVEHANTVGSALDVTVVNGRVYVADSSGGLALFK